MAVPVMNCHSAVFSIPRTRTRSFPNLPMLVGNGATCRMHNINGRGRTTSDVGDCRWLHNNVVPRLPLPPFRRPRRTTIARDGEQHSISQVCLRLLPAAVYALSWRSTVRTNATILILSVLPPSPTYPTFYLISRGVYSLFVTHWHAHPAGWAAYIYITPQ